jgi:hypothetical protein
MENALYYFGAD